MATQSVQPGGRQVAFQWHRTPAPTIGSTTGAATLIQKTASTAYQPSCGNEPYASLKKYDAKRRLVSAELDGFWTVERDLLPRPDRTLLDTFFPIHKRRKLEDFQLGDKYGDVQRRSAVQRRRRKDLTRGWKNWPSPPLTNQKAIKEKDITAQFIPLLDHIIAVLGLEANRAAIDFQDSRITCRDNGDLGPDIFIWARGSPAFPPMHHTPMESTTFPGKRKRGANLDDVVKDKGHVVDWRSCLCPIEVKTEENRGGPENKTTFFQLGTYVREVFAAQVHRRYVPSLVVTECTVEFLLWDRGGVVVSERFDYHEEDVENPANDKHLRFCNILAGIMEWDDTQLGFDPTIWYHGQELHITTKETVVENETQGQISHEVKYAVDATVFRPYTLRDRGSTCLRVHKLGPPIDDTRCLILDSWVNGGREQERAIYQKLTDALVNGIAPLHHIEDVVYFSKIRGVSWKDEVKHNRQAECFARDINLVHTRSVLLCNGAPLENFTSVKELVSVLYDTIHAHGQAYLEAGVLHRDIVPWNLFISQHSSSQPSRGMLLDFSCATFIEPHLAVPRPDPTPGAAWFMSYNSLRRKNTNSHLDDLESFYWILCVIITLHSGPGPFSPRLDQGTEMKSLLQEDWMGAAFAKRLHFQGPFDLPVAPFFTPAVVRLARNLHLFFHKRIVAQENAAEARESSAYTDAGADYAEIYGYFSRAMRDIEAQSAAPYPVHQRLASSRAAVDDILASIETMQYRLAF